MIGLGAECTKPIMVPEEDSGKKKKKNRLQLSLEDDGVKRLGVMRATAEGRATVSVSDCLACSGCVTSAETVLLSRDSKAELTSLMASGATVVFSMSQASLASIGDACGARPGAVLWAVRELLAPATVLHAADAHDLCLLEQADEFLARLKAGNKIGELPAPSEAVSRGRVRRASRNETLGPPRRADDAPLPLLASECPGFVCFVEKTAPHALPYLSSSRSTMTAFGSLLKAGRLPDLGHHGVKHVHVGPCADKKLEAARKDLLDDKTLLPDVDMALTTAELVDYLGGIASLSPIIGPNEAAASATAHGGSGAGGALDFIYRAAAAALGLPPPGRTLELKRRRNDDLKEIDLHLPDGTTLTFARAYGFRNVQKIVADIKRHKSPYHFVEVMACPVSC